MSHLFFHYPATLYDLQKKRKPLLMTDLTRGFKIAEIVKDNIAVYYDYIVDDGDRPDTIAQQYYDDETLDWIILVTNGLIDPQWDWPLSYNTFRKYINKKYGSVGNAYDEVHHYEQITQAHKVNFDNSIVPEETVEIDLTTYNTLSSLDKKLITAYDYEEKVNEKKRQLKILDEQFLPAIIEQVEGVF
jgi:hypothetical protein